MEDKLYMYAAHITRIIDGDTFEMDIDMGFHIHIHITCRVLELNTPEKFGKEKVLGLKCKEFAERTFLNGGEDVYVHTTKTDSFGRWLCHVYTNRNSDTYYSWADKCTEVQINKLSDNYSEDAVKAL